MRLNTAKVKVKFRKSTNLDLKLFNCLFHSHVSAGTKPVTILFDVHTNVNIERPNLIILIPSNSMELKQSPKSMTN